MIDDAQQYEQLTRLYREFGDQELLALGRDMSDLTDTAQEVLRGEIARRRLSLSSGSKVSADGVDKGSPVDPMDQFASLAPEDCVWEFAENEDALAAGEALRAAKIDCDVLLPGGNTYMRAPRLAVMPEDVERARQILSKPIPEEFMILVRTRDQFVVPICPGCGATDPLLEAIDPANQWRCELCDRVWVEEDPH